MWQLLQTCTCGTCSFERQCDSNINKTLCFSCESRSCSGHCDNDVHFTVSSSCISVIRGTENMPFNDCNENFVWMF